MIVIFKLQPNNQKFKPYSIWAALKLGAILIKYTSIIFMICYKFINYLIITNFIKSKFIIKIDDYIIDENIILTFWTSFKKNDDNNICYYY